MEIGEALEIVYELANECALDPKTELRNPRLMKEITRQQEALTMVHDLIVNEFGIE